ncbi:gliding motility protein [Dyadobacter sp. CY312]|uniref:gliding motility protein GldB-related protein n=1 Tax=Dyadobacter sp. CY312 TaxID=2907303 RepID=UPI001F1DE0CF|nr:gliding motility protein [Dyadobacter sp. CY312]MCE7042941.1 gliding motility protein [Dyadobacter sp. CY312]
MTFFRNLALFSSLITFVISCKTDNREVVDTSSVQMDIAVENLDQELFKSKSVQDVQNFLNKHSYLKSLYFTDSQTDTTQLPAQLYNMSQNPGFQEFRAQIDTIIGDRNSNIINPLKEAFKRIKVYYPDFKAPKIQFMVSGFTGSDLYVSDSLVIIGLDFFGGPKSLYRPNVYDYQLRKYEKGYIVPSIVFFLSNKYNYLDAADATLLSDMIGYGKGYEFVKQVMPDTPDSLILGYSEDNLIRTYNSQLDLWSFFITNKLLYEKNELKKQKYIGERPFTVEIGNKVPGGIAKWLGWRIVSRYMEENPKITLQDLMKNGNSGQILQESGYKGQKDEDE